GDGQKRRASVDRILVLEQHAIVGIAYSLLSKFLQGFECLCPLIVSLPTYNGRERPPLRIAPPAGAPAHKAAVKLRLFLSAAGSFLWTTLPGTKHSRN